MKLIVFLSVLVIFLPLAFAETQIFSGKVITGTDKVIEGGIFRFTYDEASNKVFVQTPATGLIIENGGCKSNNIFRVCINSANFSYKNITTYVYYYELNVDIYKLTGSLSAASKIAQSSLLQGESAKFTITIINPTDFEITKIGYSQNLTQFQVTEVAGCDFDDGYVKWNGSLQPKYDKTCTAKIIGYKEGKYSLAGNLSYFNGYETEKIVTNATLVTVLPKQLKVSYFIDNGIAAGETFYLNLSLQNIHESEEIDAALAITLPSHVSLIKDVPVFDKDARTLRRSLTLKPRDSANYSLYLEKNSQGTEPINSKFAYIIKGINDVIENSTFVDIISAQPKNETAEPKIQESNATSNRAVVQEPLQSPQAAGANKTTAAGNKSAGQAAIAKIEKKTFAKELSSRFSKNEVLLLAGVAFIVLLLIFSVNKIRKRKKPVIGELAALNEIREKILKNDEQKPKTKDF